MATGLRDAVTGSAGTDLRRMEADGTWAGSTAVNSYTGERVSVAGRLRSYDTYDLGGGIDTLLGTDGDDALFYTTAGSARRDTAGTLVAADAHFAGVERFVMGEGSDVLDLTAGAGGAASYADARFIFGDTDGNRTSGTAAGDVLWGGGRGEFIYGDDFFLGGTATGGADTLRGGAGNDFLHGDAATVLDSATCGADVLEGGAGDDQLYGDAQNFSSFTGGTRGADDFVFRAESGLDTVGDFQVGVDDILVSTAAYGHDSFGDLTITQGPGGAVVALDGSDDTITLTGINAAALSAADFEFIA